MASDLFDPRTMRRLVLGLATLTLWGSLVGVAQAAPECIVASTTATVSPIDGSATIVVNSGAIWVDGIACDTATVTTIDSIHVAPAFGDTVTIDLSGGAFAPGATDEGDGGSEIEFSTELGWAGPLGLVLTDGPDHLIGGNLGLNLNPNEAVGDTDLASSSFVLDRMQVTAGDGDDSIELAGGNGTGTNRFVGAAILAMDLGGGDDLLLPGNSGHEVDGRAGSDTMSYEHLNVPIGYNYGSMGDDVLTQIERLIGTRFDDSFLEGDPGMTFVGLDGADYFRPVLATGVEGGPGLDWLDLQGGGGGRIVDLRTNTTSIGSDPLSWIDVEYISGTSADDLFIDGPGDIALSGMGGIDTFDARASVWGARVNAGPLDIEDYRSDILEEFSIVLGSSQVDVIRGSYVDEVEISGRGGDDLLRGLDGDDVLHGGRGDDRLYGGEGVDICRGGPGIDIVRLCEA